MYMQRINAREVMYCILCSRLTSIPSRLQPVDSSHLRLHNEKKG